VWSPSAAPLPAITRPLDSLSDTRTVRIYDAHRTITDGFPAGALSMRPKRSICVLLMIAIAVTSTACRNPGFAARAIAQDAAETAARTAFAYLLFPRSFDVQEEVLIEREFWSQQTGLLRFLYEALEMALAPFWFMGNLLTLRFLWDHHPTGGEGLEALFRSFMAFFPGIGWFDFDYWSMTTTLQEPEPQP
jgi:hypothetical protein